MKREMANAELIRATAFGTDLASAQCGLGLCLVDGGIAALAHGVETKPRPVAQHCAGLEQLQQRNARPSCM